MTHRHEEDGGQGRWGTVLIEELARNLTCPRVTSADLCKAFAWAHQTQREIRRERRGDRNRDTDRHMDGKACTLHVDTT